MNGAEILTRESVLGVRVMGQISNKNIYKRTIWKQDKLARASTPKYSAVVFTHKKETK